MHAPSHELRDIDPRVPLETRWAARLHRELFAQVGLIAQLSERLLARFAYTTLVRDGLMKATVALVDNQPAGLATYTTDSKAVHQAVTNKYLGRVVREALVSLLLEPRMLLGVPGAIRHLFERRHERIDGGAPVAEVLAIGVLPPYRSPEFIRRTGVRIADQLLARSLTHFRHAGVREARGVVLANNLPALAFFRMRASRIEPYSSAVDPSYQVWFDVEKLLGTFAPSASYDPVDSLSVER
jgi:ribosomal protein S18 acetylase RimI-like enzyme